MNSRTLRFASVALALPFASGCAHGSGVLADYALVAPDKAAITYVPWLKGFVVTDPQPFKLVVRVCDSDPEGALRRCKDSTVLSGLTTDEALSR
jgi:hypothetical protein